MTTFFRFSACNTLSFCRCHKTKYCRVPNSGCVHEKPISRAPRPDPTISRVIRPFSSSGLARSSRLPFYNIVNNISTHAVPFTTWRQSHFKYSLTNISPYAVAHLVLFLPRGASRHFEYSLTNISAHAVAHLVFAITMWRQSPF